MGGTLLMRYALVSIAYNEERFIAPFLKHIPDWVEEKIVLVSTLPWQGEPEPKDRTADIAREMGAQVIENYWTTEHEQRNTGQSLLQDYDYIIVLDPDEYLTQDGWKYIKDFGHDANAYVPQTQYTYWKKHMVIYPPEDYKQIVLVRPTVRFIDKRVVNTGYAELPILLHHMSWARTDKECLSKISHYAHAHELLDGWYENVWLTDRTENLHPLTPESLKRAIPATLPKELEELGLWP